MNHCLSFFSSMILLLRIEAELSPCWLVHKTHLRKIPADKCKKNERLLFCFRGKKKLKVNIQESFLEKDIKMISKFHRNFSSLVSKHFFFSFSVYTFQFWIEFLTRLRETLFTFYSSDFSFRYNEVGPIYRHRFHFEDLSASTK